MNKYILLKSVLAVLPGQALPQKSDILVDTESGLMEHIAPEITEYPPDKTDVVETYRGMLAMPGFIDPHVHFRYPGKAEAEDWFTGSLAALSGGVTTVLDMPNNSPPTTDKTGLLVKLDHIAQKSLINYGLFGGLTLNNLDFLLENENIKAIKVYMASTTGDLLLNGIGKLDFSDHRKIFCFHAEDDHIIKQNEAAQGAITEPWQHTKIRSEEAALKATREVIAMQKKTGANFHVAHVSTPAEIAELENSGVSFECAPHHLFCSGDNYSEGGFLWKCNPPLREASTRDEMRKALFQEKVPMIATDHAPHPLADKQTREKTPASGIPSLEAGSHLVLNAMAEGHIGIAHAARILSTNTARRFQIQRRGELKTGYFADISLVDPAKIWTFQPDDIFSKCAWSPFLNFTFKARVIGTFVNGREFTPSILKTLRQAKEFQRTHQIYQV